MNQNNLPIPTTGNPLLDERINVGAMEGTTLGQMREVSQQLIDLKGLYPDLVDSSLAGMATHVTYLVDRNVELSK